MKFRYLDRTSNRLLFFANMLMCGSMVRIRTHNDKGKRRSVAESA